MDDGAVSSFMNNPKAQRFIQLEQQRHKVREIINDLTERCFDQCVTTPGHRLDGKTETCIKNCVERFIDSSNYVANRMSRSAAAAQTAPESSFS